LQPLWEDEPYVNNWWPAKLRNRSRALPAPAPL